jgi:hypothetical protein
MRRRTVKGRITSWYLPRLNRSRSNSAIDHRKLTFSPKLFMVVIQIRLGALPGTPAGIFKEIPELRKREKDFRDRQRWLKTRMSAWPPWMRADELKVATPDTDLRSAVNADRAYRSLKTNLRVWLKTSIRTARLLRGGFVKLASD